MICNREYAAGKRTRASIRRQAIGEWREKDMDVLIIGAEYKIGLVENYLKQGAEVCAVCFEPDVRLDRLSCQFENLMLLCISKRQSHLTDALQYLTSTVRLPCGIDDFSTVIYVK